ncbi:MAG: glycosyl transferase [Nitrospinaceae bacterium]|nr:glycosyl transferase [Nitrospinaceae bacterium]NIR55602.1 glycosyl transferase [Nitrospinaceae bacterium]NIS86036.1 glycosyl transferase [Nitrospinaceae bacterium]NIT82879.1 glycosyl transferase [Nitrospinaceae bacterium]NIU45084.1 glycosyl transferase [Nitrospinaceae bacterium]
MSETLKIFIGCAPNHDDVESQAVLEWSIRKHASRPVDITWMRLSQDPESPFHGWNTCAWPTPFSGFRWVVPELAGYEGRAIYMDSDFIVLADLAELWDQQFQPGKAVLAKGGGNWRLCMSLWDCAAAKPHTVPIEKLKVNPSNHQKMASRFSAGSGLIQPFKGDWNCLDARNGEDLNRIKALHYTRMSTQPQLEYALPRLSKSGGCHWYDGRTAKHPRQDVRDMFARYLKEAEANGYGIERYMQHEPFGSIHKQRFGGRAVC